MHLKLRPGVSKGPINSASLPWSVFRSCIFSCWSNPPLHAWVGSYKGKKYPFTTCINVQQAGKCQYPRHRNRPAFMRLGKTGNHVRICILNHSPNRRQKKTKQLKIKLILKAFSNTKFRHWRTCHSTVTNSYLQQSISYIIYDKK